MKITDTSDLWWKSAIIYCLDVETYLDTAEAFDAASAHVTREDVAEVVKVSADLGQHAAWLGEYADLGFDEIYLHHIGQEQRAFLDAFGDHVLPQLDDVAPAAAVAVPA